MVRGVQGQPAITARPTRLSAAAHHPWPALDTDNDLLALPACFIPDFAYDPVETVRHAEPTPGRRLALAVLIEALRMGLRAETLQPMVTARSWIVADDPADPLSFTSVCDTLGLEPDWIRRRFIRAVEKRRLQLAAAVASTVAAVVSEPGRPVAFMVMRRAAAG